ncbi:hypothetical protein, partial [Sarcina sp. DSM 11001]|uniref:hypothetical protein n=1 Tax=Sarcina sp. DSM 11001 TaxID=1798184 RepID=UPI001A9A456A
PLIMHSKFGLFQMSSLSLCAALSKVNFVVYYSCYAELMLNKLEIAGNTRRLSRHNIFLLEGIPETNKTQICSPIQVLNIGTQHSPQSLE